MRQFARIRNRGKKERHRRVAGHRQGVGRCQVHTVWCGWVVGAGGGGTPTVRLGNHAESVVVVGEVLELVAGDIALCGPHGSRNKERGRPGKGWWWWWWWW